VIAVIECHSRYVKYVQEHAIEDPLEGGAEFSYDAVTQELEPLSFDPTDEHARDYAACVRLAIAPSQLQEKFGRYKELHQCLSWAIDQEKLTGTLLVYDPDTLDRAQAVNAAYRTQQQEGNTI
jgi:hypothetical protein